MELNLVYRAEENKSLVARFLRKEHAEEEIRNNLIVYKDHVFSDMNDEAKIIRVVKDEMPHLIVEELQKVPSGFLTRRIYKFYPVQPEEIEKYMHVLCFLQNPLEINIDRDMVIARDQIVNMDRRIITIGEIRIRNNQLILRRDLQRTEVFYEFFLEEKNGFYIVKEFTRNGVKFKIV